MRRCLLLLALLVPSFAWGQTFAGRASVAADYKIVKGLHLSLEEEIRSADDFSALGSVRTTLGVSYKPFKFLKVGVGGVVINPYKVGKTLETSAGDVSYTGFWSPRYRLYGDVTGSLRWGDWQFSLRERLQLTHNSDAGMNVYQNPRNALALKSRLGVKYKRWKKVQPALSFEFRTALNGPWGTTSGSLQTTDKGKTYYDYTPAGYTHVYINRYRGNLSVDFSPGKHHSFTPYLLLDSTSDYKLDTNGAGNRFYSASYVDALVLTAGLSYVFRF